jgi:nitroreductase
MENKVLDTLLQRRSCRKYEDRQITDEELNAVLKAGMYAPSGMGKQSPIIIAVQNKEIRDRISKLNASVMGASSDPFYGAPTVLVVLADNSVGTFVEDGSLVIGNMLNAAESIGLGGCWIHRAKQVFESQEGKELLKEIGIIDPDRYTGVGNCILGYPAKGGQNPALARKEDYIIYVK